MMLNPFELMKNAKELQSYVKNMQAQLEGVTVTGESGGGLVKITLNCSFDIVAVELDPVSVDNRDIPMLQDLIRSAHTDAAEKIKYLIKEKMGPLASMAGAGGLSL